MQNEEDSVCLYNGLERHGFNFKQILEASETIGIGHITLDDELKDCFGHLKGSDIKKVGGLGYSIFLDIYNKKQEIIGNFVVTPEQKGFYVSDVVFYDTPKKSKDKVKVKVAVRVNTRPAPIKVVSPKRRPIRIKRVKI